MSRLRIALRLVLGAVLLSCAMLLLTPQQASACEVSYGYRPSVNIGDFGHQRTCSTGTSLGGSAVVAALVLGALAAAGAAAYRRGQRATDPGAALSAYLDAAGIAPSTAAGADHAS